ncbi:MAG: U32 family peptidase [Alphaproteobacteria bacterium]|nr:U32 family peptidase [Alphaproteobacteria bacterium]
MKQELLAPAGDIEAGYAALYYGADAVYLGLQKFSARATATNFDENNLNQFTAYAHHLGRKVYAAINTVVQEDELPDLLKTLDVCSKCKIDAVILQDLGVARIIKKTYPELELHASTQMAVHNKEGALFLKSLGFTRVVLARELTLPEIKEIASIEGLETEAFIHGALCYSYSGLCQFSALETKRSANRGKCLYPCRACFEKNEINKHFFSMKDMALGIDILKMPVTSLKIEGRKKSALYVAAVTDYYRHILDDKGADYKKEENIKQIFSRPWCKFHFNGKSKDIIDRNFVGHRGLLIGKISEVSKFGIELKLNHNIARFDGLQIDVKGNEKPFGFSIQNIKLNGKNVFEANSGDVVQIELPKKYPYLEKGLDVYLASSSDVKSSYPYIKPKPNEFLNLKDINVRVEVCQYNILARYDNFVSEIGGIFDKAQDITKVEDAFKQSFEKTGGTGFCLKSIEINNPDELFVPVSKINELRRDLYAKIKPDYKQGKLPEISKKESKNLKGFIIKTDNLKCLQELDLNEFAEIIYLIEPNSDVSEIKALPKNKVRIALPEVCRKPQVFERVIKSLLENGYKKWEIGNYWGFGILPTEKLDISLSSYLYMLNSQATETAKECGVSRVCFAIEDTLNNIKVLSECVSLSACFVVYQDAPLFISSGCIRDNDCKNCKGGIKTFELKKDGRKYVAISKNCQVMMFNDNPLCFANEAKEVRADFYRLDFCYRNYTPEQVKDIVSRLTKFEDVNGGLKANINSQKI